MLTQQPQIVDEIWPEVQLHGRTGRLNCTVVRLNQNVVTWYHVNFRQTISVGETIEVMKNEVIGGLKKYEVQRKKLGDRDTFMLIIRRLRQEDAGYYKCTVRIQAVNNDLWPTKLGQLTVQASPKIRISGTTTVLQAHRGHNSSLQCSATGIPYPNITWVRLDGGLLPVLPTPVAQFRSERLPLVNVDIQHMGIYRCVADNFIKPPAEHLSQLLVFHAPRTRVVQNSVGQAQNRRFSAKLECIVQGHPEPTVTWERVINNGRVRITDNQKFDINKQTKDLQNLMAMESWYSLKIINVQANDYTTYYCIAENNFGRANSTFVLFETTECQGANCPSLPPSAATSTFSINPVFLFPLFISIEVLLL
ncbi:lachesin-like isoform X2 [Biomphalaria glabrata]|uniref:Lachesin-like isoform X2 n=1 Tax=Biomphalaria glabrata TaxID=6526 RepID=A0A9W2YXX1_BIOGL|nr:lachesin-like isoform X2 [Biomphalaria glabrata]